MGYLIIRIEKRGWDLVTISSKDVKQLTVRHGLKTPHQKHVAEVLSKYGYELGPVVGDTPVYDWPLVAYIYVSSNKDGRGQPGSPLYRWPVRTLRGVRLSRENWSLFSLKRKRWSLFMEMRSFTRYIAYRSYWHACGEAVAGRMAAYWVDKITEDVDSVVEAMRGIGTDPQLTAFIKKSYVVQTVEVAIDTSDWRELAFITLFTSRASVYDQVEHIQGP